MPGLTGTPLQHPSAQRESFPTLKTLQHKQARSKGEQKESIFLLFAGGELRQNHIQSVKVGYLEVWSAL